MPASALIQSTMTAKAHISRARQLLANRSSWHNHWDDLAWSMLQRRIGFASTTVEGERRTDHLFDGTPMRAARGLANAIGGMLRPEGRKWFFLRTGDDRLDQDGAAADWLADTEERMRDSFQDPRARFRQATGEADLDLAVFGTAVLFAGESARLNHLLFQSVHLKDALVSFDDEGNARGVYRFRRLTLRQAADRWGETALSEETRHKLTQDKSDERMEFLHVVVPREGARRDALLSRNLPWTDTWIEVDAEHEILNRGFRDFPFIVPRWDTSSGEDYGRSPGMIALPDADTLQAMGETMLIAGERTADPPLAAPADGILSEVNTFPGGLSYYDPTITNGRNPFFPIESGANMPLTRDMQLDHRQQVFDAFFRNVLNLPVQGPQMTATEINERKEEFIREIGPVFGRLESDYTAPLVERTFGVMLRTGQLAPIPEVLQGEAIRFDYESPVKRIRQQTEAAATRLWRLDLEEMAANTGDPSVLDVIDADAYARFTARAAAIPHQIIASREAVARRRADREQAQQAAGEAALLQTAAENAGGLAGALKTAGLTEPPQAAD